MVSWLPSLRILLCVRKLGQVLHGQGAQGSQDRAPHPHRGAQQHLLRGILPPLHRSAVRQGLYLRRADHRGRRGADRLRTSASAATPAFCPAPTARLSTSSEGAIQKCELCAKNAFGQPTCVTGLSEQGDRLRGEVSRMKYVIIGNGTAAVGAIEGIRSAGQGRPRSRSSPPRAVSRITAVRSFPICCSARRPRKRCSSTARTTSTRRTTSPPCSAGRCSTLTRKSRPSRSRAASPSPMTDCCICTGSRPFVPPMEGLDTVENKTSFMTLDDAKHLNEMLGETNDKRVLIVGAGLIGLEVCRGHLPACFRADRHRPGAAHPAERSDRRLGAPSSRSTSRARA